MLTGELAALLATATLPVALPVEEGVSVTFNVALCPAGIVWPDDTPLALNPAPETLIFEIVRLLPPELVSVAGSVPLLPIATVPKFKLEVLAVRVAENALTVSTAALLVTLPAVF